MTNEKTQLEPGDELSRNLRGTMLQPVEIVRVTKTMAMTATGRKFNRGLRCLEGGTYADEVGSRFETYQLMDERGTARLEKQEKAKLLRREIATAKQMLDDLTPSSSCNVEIMEASLAALNAAKEAIKIAITESRN